MKAYPSSHVCDWEECKKPPKYHIDLQSAGDDSDHLELCNEHVIALREEVKHNRDYDASDWAWVDGLQP